MQHALAYDYMMRRILQLVVPFTLLVVFETVVDMVILAILSYRMGTNNIIAYTMMGKTKGET